MPKNTLFIRLLGILIFSILFITSASYADQYYDQYPGVGFQPFRANSTYVKLDDGSIYHNDTIDTYYFCPVNFIVPDGSIYFIKSIGIRFKDNRTDGYIWVVLKRKNIYTGAVHTVGSWGSGIPNASPSVQTASKGTDSGVKLVDTKKFAYWLDVWFETNGVINPGGNLRLYQVRIHYGT